MNTTQTQCIRCVLSTKDDPDIIFDEAGICSYCRAYETQELKEVRSGSDANSQLEKIVEQIKRRAKGKLYDCIIGLSGGVDSTYLAYQASKLGLKPLAIHVDNGWNSELAVRNIENIVSVLGFDLQTFVINWDEFKDLQLAFLKASVVDIELITDHAIIAKLYQLAIKHDISFILNGSNIVTESVLPTSWIHDKRDHIHIKAIHKRYGTLPIKTFPLYDSILKWKVIWKNVKSVSLLNLMPYNRNEAKQIVAKELGWRDYGGKHYESVFTRFYQGYILPQKFGIDKRKAHMSNLICSGQMSRSQALSELQKPAYDISMFKSDYDFVLKKLSLSAEQFELLMNAPIRKHSDYPIDRSIYQRFPLLRLARPVWQKIKRIRNQK